MPEKLTLETFVPLVNTKFRLQHETTTLELELIEAKDVGSSEQLEQFSILFRGPSEPFLPQRLRKVEHDQLGTIELFLLPVGVDDEGLYYEAAFGRLRQPIKWGHQPVTGESGSSE